MIHCWVVILWCIKCTPQKCHSVVYHTPLNRPVIEYLCEVSAKIKIVPGYLLWTRRSRLVQKTNIQKSQDTVPLILHSLLYTSPCLLFTALWLLYTAIWLLYIALCLLKTALSLQFTAFCLRYTALCLLYTAPWQTEACWEEGVSLLADCLSRTQMWPEDSSCYDWLIKP